MYHLLVYRSTNRSRKRIAILVRKSLESRNSPIISNELFRYSIQLLCSNSGLYNLSYLSQRFSYKQITRTEQFYLIFSFKKYHSSNKINTQPLYRYGL